MIEDVLEILSAEGRWLTPKDVEELLRARDPIRYRTVDSAGITRVVRKLRKQGYPIETERGLDRETNTQWFRIRWMTTVPPEESE